MSRYERGGLHVAGRDVLDVLRIDAGQRTLAELVSERALAAAEIAKLRDQIELLTRRGASAPEQVQYRARSTQLAACGSGAPSRRELVTNGAAAFPPTALLRLKDVCRLVGLSRSSIYGRLSEGTFPRPLRVSERCVRWRMQDLSEWSAGLTKS